MLEGLKEKVLRANLELVKSGLVLLTWGNVSQIDRDNGLIVIKPSGVSYDNMKAEDMVVVDLNGKVVEGAFRPSSDTLTHIELYKAFEGVGGVVHTHSTFATAFAQAKLNIPCYGTTHADHFYGDIPVTCELSKSEVEKDYELNTGKVIVETFKKYDYHACPSVLVASHAPFSWGKDAFDAVNNAIVLEEVARMAHIMGTINVKEPVPKYLMDKHYFRKHGAKAYYGQK